MMKKNQYFDVIKELSEKQLLFHLYGTQLLLLLISSILGVILFDNKASFIQLYDWTDYPAIFLVGGGVGLAVVIIDMLLTKMLPESFYDDGGLNERIFQKRGILHIAIISFLVAFSEELLFRGVLQTHFGIIVSSSLFALVHYRYLFNWFLFMNITLLSFLIGYIYMVTGNLIVTVFMHFVIDFLLGIMIRIKYSKNRKGCS
jgi:uncharacterized protein